MEEDERIHIGRIVGVHGIKGAVKVFPLTDFPKRFATLDRVYLSSGEEVHIRSVDPYKKGFLIRFKEYSDREGVKALMGQFIQIPRKEACVPSEGEYLYCDLVDSNVYNTKGEFIGNVTCIYENNPLLLEVSFSDKTFLLPFVKALVPLVDIENKRLVINPIEGLIEG